MNWPPRIMSHAMICREYLATQLILCRGITPEECYEVEIHRITRARGRKPWDPHHTT